METTMELDDLKQAWTTLDRRLEQNNSLQLTIYREGKLDKLRRRLRPLVWGQAIQMSIAVLLVITSASFWLQHRDQTHLFVAGLILHVYGVAVIIFGACMQQWIHSIDYSAPVLTIQKQLASLRRLYVVGGLFIGLPWWLLWIPLLMMSLKIAFGVDLYLNAPAVIEYMTLVGVAGLAFTWVFHRWARRRPTLASALEKTAAGSSLNRAQAFLDEIRQFEDH